MTIRKRRQPTPHFKLPPPYSPVTGQRAPLDFQGVFPFVAMMQVAAEDTHKNYVICRGHDIRHNKFYDYEAGNPDKPGIAVAKPYGRRRLCVYRIAQILPAILPMQSPNPQPATVPWRVGKNPGVATVSDGHPADLDEEVTELYTDEGVLIDWMFVEDDEPRMMVRATECIKPGDTNKTAQPQKFNGTCWEDDETKAEVNVCDCRRWLLALVDDCFEVELIGCNEEAACYQPTMPYGLTRRVKITAEIACGACGEVKVLPGNDGCPVETVGSEETDCTINVCNAGNRKVGCDADEYATLHCQPGPCTLAGGSEPAPTCYGWIVPNPRAMTAEATAYGQVCGGPATLTEGSIVFDDVCNWTPRTPPSAAQNPAGLYACTGDTLLLRWNDEDCGWDIVQVEHHFIDPALLSISCDSSCAIWGVKMSAGFAVQQCQDCGLTEAVLQIQGEWVNVIGDLTFTCDTECAAGTISYKRICAICGTSESDVPEDKSLPMVSAELLTGFGKTSTQDSDGNILTCGLSATKAEFCFFGCKLADGDPATVAFDAIEPLTDAEFDCTACPTFTPTTRECFVLCMSAGETVWAASECDCDPCTPASA